MHLISTLGNRSNIVADNTRAEHRHQFRLHCHSVAQDTQMVVINIGIRCLHHFHKLVQNVLTRCFNAQHIVNLTNVVTIRSRVINEIQHKQVHQICARGI